MNVNIMYCRLPLRRYHFADSSADSTSHKKNLCRVGGILIQHLRWSVLFPCQHGYHYHTLTHEIKCRCNPRWSHLVEGTAGSIAP